MFLVGQDKYLRHEQNNGLTFSFLSDELSKREKVMFSSSLIFLFLLTIPTVQSVQNFKLESQMGSTIILPPCLATSQDTTTILFKSDSAELLIMNGKLISKNPRFVTKNNYSSELIIKSVQSSDQGQYECRTEQTIDAIVQLNVIHLSTIHLTVPENSNLTLQCMENGLWIIEESHRGGPVQTQYTNEFVITNVQRDDPRFRRLICSSLNGYEKREYVLDVTYKPTVKLMLSTRRRLICLICAHPLPHRVHWWWNEQKERDDHIHQTNINQSCIAQEITFLLNQRNSNEQMITCEAENPYGIDRDTLIFKASSTVKTRPNSSIELTNRSRLKTSSSLFIIFLSFLLTRKSFE